MGWRSRGVGVGALGPGLVVVVGGVADDVADGVVDGVAGNAPPGLPRGFVALSTPLRGAGPNTVASECMRGRGFGGMGACTAPSPLARVALAAVSVLVMMQPSLPTGPCKRFSYK